MGSEPPEPQPPFEDDTDRNEPPSDDGSTLQQLWSDIEEATGRFPMGAVKDGLLATAAVAVGMLIIVSISGVYPPFAVVSSGSMDPNIQTGDVVYMVEETRFTDKTTDEAIITYREGVDEGVKTFGSYGTVMTFEPDTDFAKSVMHRPRFTVTEGENWYEKANKDYLSADSCSGLRNCPAPRSGYITKGDNNPEYDHALGMYGPIPSDQIIGKVFIRLQTGPIFALTSLGSQPSTATTPTGQPVPVAEEPVDSENTTIKPRGD